MNTDRDLNVLLIGECFSPNLGDPLICDVVQRILNEKWSTMQFFKLDLSGRTEQNFQANLVHTFEKKALLKLSTIWKGIPEPRLIKHTKKTYGRLALCLTNLNEICGSTNIAVAVFVGGSIFMDYFAETIYHIVRLLKYRHIPIIFHSCGFSSLSQASIELLQKALSCRNIASISLRDGFNTFNTLFKKTVAPKETFDTAISASRFYASSSQNTDRIGVGTFYSGQEYLLKVSNALLERNHPFSIFTNGGQDDYSVAKNIFAKLDVNDNDVCCLVDRPVSIQQLIDTVTQFSHIYSYRLHSQIIALSYGMVATPFVWDNKIVEFYEKLDIGDWCVNPNNDDLFFIDNTKPFPAELHQRIVQAKCKVQEDLITEIKEVIS